MTDADPLMSIGTFSRASLVSVKALRSYHEQGLLVPASVDPVTGYRSYRVSQLTDAQIVKRLRDLDVPLRDVAEVMAARDPEITRKVLREHEAVMRARLDAVTRIVDELQQSVSYPTSHTPVHVRTDPQCPVLAVDGTITPDDYATFLGRAFALLHAAATRLGIGPAGAGGALYPAEITDGEPEDVTAFVPVAGSVALPDDLLAAGVRNELLAAITAAVMTHAGSYDSIGDTYRQLGAWVAHHATSADAPIRELYVVSVDEQGRLLPDDELRTDIVWPVRTTHHPHREETP